MLEESGFRDVVAEDRTDQVLSLTPPVHDFHDSILLDSSYNVKTSFVNSNLRSLRYCSGFTIHIHSMNVKTCNYVFVYFFPQFLEVLQRELDVVEKDKDAFIHDFSEVLTMLKPVFSIFC